MKHQSSADWSANVLNVSSTLLDRPPSCAEFVPQEAAQTSNHFIVGTYNLQSESSMHEKQSRDGSLLLYQINGKELKLVETIPYPAAILDLHFYQNSNFFAVVSSTGALSIFRVTKKQQIYTMRHVATFQVLPENILILSLAWYPYQQSLVEDTGRTPIISLTASNGGVFIVRLSSDFTSYNILNDGVPLIQHNDNAWTCCISNNFIFSGGDDSILSRVDFEQDAMEAQGEVKLITSLNDSSSQTNFKGHNAGVTAILVLPTKDVNSIILLTGSYDDHVRVWETPSLHSKLKALAKLDLGGGVWRLKMIESHISNEDTGASEWTVLASCMHAGARILNVKRDSDRTWGIEVLAEMRAHQSMCYASDAQVHCHRQKGSNESSQERAHARTWTVISTSFYDKLLRIWEWHPVSSTST
ncbi:hypothetical protein K3495_g507 [Podosphaera aphanis]|nr:hypothetical protein K3495_g507 [Podosphaera aphanis]